MHRFFRVLFVLTLTLLVGIAPARAGVAVFSGTLDAGDPTMPVVAISTPDCTAQLVTPVHYEAHTFFVRSTSTYNISLTSTGSSPNFASFYLYEIQFDPNNGLVNCIGAANSGTPKQINETLLSNTTYIVVPFDDQFAQPGGNYEVTISGSGAVVAGLPTELIIPTLSPWGMALLGALLALGGLVAIRRTRAG